MSARIIKKRLNKLLKVAISKSKDGKEICGLIVDTGYFLELIQAKNKTKTPGGFSFYLKEIAQVEKAVDTLGYKIVGTFHSHPFSNAKPGAKDLVGAEDGELILIIDCMKKEPKLWKISGGKPKKASFELI